jgi:hypothetical protein
MFEKTGRGSTSTSAAPSWRNTAIEKLKRPPPLKGFNK